MRVIATLDTIILSWFIAVAAGWIKNWSFRDYYKNDIIFFMKSYGTK